MSPRSEAIQAVKSKVNLVDLVSEHVVLKKSGHNFQGLCPFHAERTPSFYVSEKKQLYHCYGCKAGGDVIRFLMDIQGLSFFEALQELAERSGVSLPQSLAGKQDEKQIEHQKKLQLAYKLNRFAAAFFRSSLQKNLSPREYLKTREISPELQNTFYLGACGDQWDQLAEHLNRSQAPEGLALDLGLIRPSKKEKGTFDLFRNRIIFPILNTRGKVLGFGGRILPEAHEKNIPKYLNSPDSFLFHKNKVLFGLSHAAKYIREQNEVFVVEGYFDVLSLVQGGFPSVVATCGTALSVEHIQQLKHLSSKITILFDGDQAGKSATDRAMEVGLGQGILLNGVFLPKGKDPDEWVRKHSKEEVSEMLSSRRVLLDQRIEELLGKPSDLESRRAEIQKVGTWLKLLRDPVAVRLRLDHIQSRFQINPHVFEPILGPIRGYTRRSEGIRPIVENSSSHRLLPWEKTLLRGLMNWPSYRKIFQEFSGKLPPSVKISDTFLSPEAKRFAAFFVEKTSSNRFEGEPLMALEPCAISLLEEENNKTFKSVITEILMTVEEKLETEVLKRSIHQGLSRLWAQFSQRIRLALAESDRAQDAPRQAQLMKEYLDVQRKIKEFNKLYDKF